MKKNLVFVAGLLFLIVIEIFVVADVCRARRPSPPTAASGTVLK